MADKEEEASAPREHPPVSAPEDEDSDLGYEDLDDILDQFDPKTAPKSSSAQNAATDSAMAPSTSGPGRPPVTDEPPEQSEEEFMAKLQAELASTMSSLGVDSKAEANKQAREITEMGKELDEFTTKMEKEGLKPEDLLRAILGEEEIDPSTFNASGVGSSKTGESAKADAPTSTSESKDTFEETIRKTMERMQASDSSARDATHSASENNEDILAQLMKAMESADPDNPNADDGDLSNLFLNMMQQLTSKDLLYEPMKELDEKFPDWLEKNKGKLSSEDQERYQTQRTVVKEIVDKFEEKDYSDGNEKDRAYVWERMQKMQAAGSPPEDLITAPFPGAFGPGGAGSDDPMSQCPTQ